MHTRHHQDGEPYTRRRWARVYGTLLAGWLLVGAALVKTLRFSAEPMF